MAKVILAVGVFASGILGFALWRRVERDALPPSGNWLTIMDSEGDPDRLKIVGAWEDREASAQIRTVPASFWPLVRDGDEFRARRRTLAIPMVGWTLTQLQWEIRRDKLTFEFGYPPAWRFWGLVGSISAAPIVLFALVAGAVLLASGKKEMKP